MGAWDTPTVRLRRLQFLVLRFFHRPMLLPRRRRRWITNPLRVSAYHRIASRLGSLLLAALRRRFFLRRLLVRALQIHARLERLLHQVRATAFRTLLGNRLRVRREIALGIIRAAPEDVSAPRLALGQVALAALRALHSFNQVLLHILAFGITRARHELAIRALPQHQRLAAQRAVFARRLRRLLLLFLAQLADRLARRIG